MATDFGFMPIKSGKFFFISYNTEDSSRVAPIVKYMNECSVPFWYDYGLEYGKEWETQIAAHIADCEAVLMFVTKGLFYKEKSYVRKEYDEAVIYGKTIIPIFLDDINPSALPRHSVGFYVDLNRLHNVSYAKNNSVQTIAQNAARALGVKLSESSVSAETNSEPTPSSAPKPAETKKTESSSASRKSKTRKPMLIAVICTVVALSVIGAVIGVVLSGNADSNFQATSSVPEIGQTGEVSSDSSKAYTVTKDGLKYKIEGDKATITRYTGNESTLTIPSEIDGTTVTSIGDHAFVQCNDLIEIIIPDGVTSIGNYAFSQCNALTEITLPDSVTFIGDHAFSQCNALTEITLPNSITAIGNKAFYSCIKLTKVIISDNVTSIGESVFYGCISLTEITIPSSVTSIGDSAFSYCSNLTEIIIPDGVTSIGDSAFCGCSSLAEITLPNSVTFVGDFAFCDCSSLTRITIPDSVTSINYYTFSGCINLTEITIPKCVTIISERAFLYCTSLKKITIPDSVTSIGYDAFWGCDITVSAPHKASYYGYTLDDGVTWVVE